MNGIAYHVCGSCGLAVYPERLLCSRCGNSTWERKTATRGVVEDATVVQRSIGASQPTDVRLGTVRLSAGPLVIARLVGDAIPGRRVTMRLHSGALEGVARR